MAIEINVPEIGTEKVEVIEILVSVGDKVEEDQSLITVEGDKVSIEIPAPFAGKVREIKVAPGDEVSVGTLIMLFDAVSPVDSTSSPDNTSTFTVPQQASGLKEVHLPDTGSEVEVTEIMVSIGDHIDKNQPLFTVRGDQISVEIPAPFAGRVKEIKIAPGEKVSTGALVMLFEVSDVNLAQRPAAAEVEKVAEVPTTCDNLVPSSQGLLYASPVVRRLARELGINLAKVKGSGRKGRILKEDVQEFVRSAIEQLEPGMVSGSKRAGNFSFFSWPKVDFSQFGETETVPLHRTKKASGENLARNWVMIPHVTQWDSVDITELEEFRKEQNIREAKKGSSVKLTLLVFIIKAVAKAIDVFPLFNSSVSEDGEKLILKKYLNIGIAVDTPHGLVVPVLKELNRKGIIEISRELKAVSERARSGGLVPSDTQGSCFTISNLGGLGGTAFTPIVNAPDVAILGVSRSEMKPFWNGKEFIPRLTLPLSLSYDHRAIDGVEGARFITYLNEHLSDLRRLVL